MILQAHRGARRHYPENTLPAYYGAVREGYSFIELDTKFTKDSQCVLLHDRTVNRTGRTDDGRELPPDTKIADLTLAQAKALDFGLHFGGQFRGTRIPTLAELLKFVKETGMPVKFDNVMESHTDAQIESVLEAVAESGLQEIVGFTAKDVAFVRRVAQKLPHCILHYDGPTSKKIYEELKEASFGHTLFIWLPSEPKHWLPYPPATKADVEEARQYGKVGLWTAHDAASLQYILSLSPDAMELDGDISPDDLSIDDLSTMTYLRGK